MTRNFQKLKKKIIKLVQLLVVKNKKIVEKIQCKNDFCTPLYFLTSTEFFLPSQNSKLWDAQNSPKNKNDKVKKYE